MSVKLIEVNKDNLYGETIGSAIYPTKNLWGRCCLTDKPDVYQIMQSPVSCKDYVVDTYYRESSSGFLKKTWTKKQRHQNCTYILLPNISNINNLLKSLDSYLHPKEDSLGLERTQVHLVHKDDTLPAIAQGGYKAIIVVGDTRWKNNATIYSMYLSIIRLCFTQIQTGTLDFAWPKKDYCNEHNYYDALPAKGQKYCNKWFDNLLPFFEEAPKGFDACGYMSSLGAPSHGATGIFYLLNLLVISKRQMLEYTQHYHNKLGTGVNYLWDKCVLDYYGKPLEAYLKEKL